MKTGGRRARNAESKCRLRPGRESFDGTYRSLADLPAEIRAEFEKALASGNLETLTISNGVGPCPPFGETAPQTVEQIPPEMREEIERLLKDRSTAKTFQVQGPDGRQQTYHSVDEMPPHVRELYEKTVKEMPADRHACEQGAEQKRRPEPGPSAEATADGDADDSFKW